MCPLSFNMWKGIMHLVTVSVYFNNRAVFILSDVTQLT